MKKTKIKTIFKIIFTGLFCVILIYSIYLKDIFSTWGTTNDELHSFLPGDEIIFNPKINITRAITINAGPEKIFPWLVQMGINKGGLYSYDWLENIFGLNIHSSDSIVEKWQTLKVGDILLLGPMGGPKLMEIEKNNYLLFGGINENFSNTWSFNLSKINNASTRLIIRSRYTYPNSLGNFLIWKVITEPAHFFMEEKMMRGIKKRVENNPGI